MSQVSIDLTTLENYNQLTSGETYPITVIAKGNPNLYIDSDPSTGVNYTKPPYTITNNLTNLTADPNNPTTIDVGGSVTLKYISGTSYNVPAAKNITVTNANTGAYVKTGLSDGSSYCTFTISNPTGNVTVSIDGVVTYPISNILTNVVADSLNSPNIALDAPMVLLDYTPLVGYKLPTTINVTNATSSWSSSDGRLRLSAPTGNVFVSITGVVATYSIYTSLTHVTASSGNPSTMTYFETKTLTFTADGGYELPDNVTVNNASYTWDKSTGTLTLTNATDGVGVTITGHSVAPPSTGYTVTFSNDYSIGDPVAGVNLLLTDSNGDTEFAILDPDFGAAGQSFSNIVSMTLTAGDSTYIEYVMGGVTDDLYTVDGEEATLVLTGDCTITYCAGQECIAADTLVLMADGTQKQLGEIHTGDYILSYNWDTMQLVPNKVIYSSCEESDWNSGAWDCPRYFKRTFSDGTVIKQAFAHRFYNREEKRFVYMEQWSLGQHTYAYNNGQGQLVEYINSEKIYEPIRFARITGENGTNYFANGLLTGDRHCPQNLILPPEDN